MKDKLKLLGELKDKFEEVKKEYGFVSSLEDIEKFCYLGDGVLSDGYVSENHFIEYLIYRILEPFNSWAGNFHSWIMPSPQDLGYMTESKQLSEEEKKEISALLSKIYYFIRRARRVVYDPDKKEIGKFIDDAVDFFNNTLTPAMIKYTKKFEEFWGKSKE